MKKAVVSGIGHDRPGIVAGFTQVLFRHGCNIEDSSMTILGPEFAMILIISMADTVSEEAVAADLEVLEKELGLSVAFKPLQLPAAPAAATNNLTPYMISVSGHDRTGITYEVANLLASFQINITDLNAQSITGEADSSVYIMMVEAGIPQGFDFGPLETAFKDLETTLGIEIRYHEIEPVAL
ncbi:MAG: hypothetical protein KTR14_10410 [Vampirovibrio sp.]|nr:hypothetical protein [Vampirovibrio sp.]